VLPQQLGWPVRISLDLFLRLKNNPNRFGLAQTHDIPAGRDAARTDGTSLRHMEAHITVFASWDEQAEVTKGEPERHERRLPCHFRPLVQTLSVTASAG